MAIEKAMVRAFRRADGKGGSVEVVEIFTTPTQIIKMLDQQGDYPEICLTFEADSGSEINL